MDVRVIQNFAVLDLQDCKDILSGDEGKLGGFLKLLEEKGVSVRFYEFNEKEEDVLGKLRIWSQGDEANVMETVLDRDLLLSPRFRKVSSLVRELRLQGEPPFILEKGKERREIESLRELKEVIMETGRRGLDIQRYKGLGEMNPEQLWETTMNPENRKLLLVSVEDAEEADRVFSILMGDEVEPRKQFIYQYAKEVRNLDV